AGSILSLGGLVRIPAARRGGDRVARRHRGQLDTSRIKEWVGSDQECVGPLARKGCEDCIYLAGGAGIVDSDLQSENASSRFDVLRNGRGARSISRIDARQHELLRVTVHATAPAAFLLIQR